MLFIFFGPDFWKYFQSTQEAYTPKKETLAFHFLIRRSFHEFFFYNPKMRLVTI